MVFGDDSKKREKKITILALVDKKQTCLTSVVLISFNGKLDTAQSHLRKEALIRPD